MDKTIKLVIKLIIVVLIILLIAFGTIIFLINQGYIEEEGFAPEGQSRYEEEKTYQTEEVTNQITYYAVKRIISKYGLLVAQKNTKSLYGMIDEDYINSERIAESGILEKTENITIENELSDYFSITPYIDKMYEKQEENTDVISVISYGHFKYDIDNKRENFGIIVEIDLMNNTYCIIPTKKVFEEWPTAEEFANFHSAFQEIKGNDYNTLSLKSIEEGTIVNDLVGKYIETVQTDIEKAYNSLDEDYRNKKFGTLENYQKYVDENKAAIISYNVNQYIIEEDGDITRYICKDSNDKYWIFEETAILDYTLKLDSYTVETQDYIDRYNNGNEETKISMNIDKWMALVNDREYEKAYQYLDPIFRSDRFGSEEAFENYMRERYPSYYDVYIDSISRESNAYATKVRIIKKTKDGSTLDQPTFQRYIMMQLGSDREFVMSFTVN